MKLHCMAESGVASLPLRRALDGKKLLIFDFDGTVADTSPLHAAAFAEILAPFGIRLDYADLAGMKTADAIRRGFVIAGKELDEAKLPTLIAEKQRLAREAIETGLELLPGVAQFLNWAQGRYRLAMATSGSRGTVEWALTRVGLAGRFDPFICADDITHAKPHPEALLAVLGRVGCAINDALVFEDSRAGFDAADAAGLSWVDARINLWDQLHV